MFIYTLKTHLKSYKDHSPEGGGAITTSGCTARDKSPGSHLNETSAAGMCTDHKIWLDSNLVI